MQPKQKRTFNAFAIQFKRGRSTGPTHQAILKEIVIALKDYGKIWYDHMYLPAVPLTLEPTPVKIPHWSPCPDVVLLTDPDKKEMFMIQVQKVIPIKRPPKGIPHNMKEEVKK